MSVVTVSTQIAAPRERVWQVVMDPNRLADWVTIHRKLVHADGGPPRVGYEMEQQIHLRGVSLDVHWRLVECEPAAQGRLGGPRTGALACPYRICAEWRGWENAF